MPDLTSAGSCCPTCGARLRPGAPWCTQCFTAGERPADRTPADERPAGPTPGEGASAVGPGHEPVRASVLTAAPGDVHGAGPAGGVPDASATWPCTLCGGGTPLSEPVCGDCGAPFLAAVRASAPLLVLPLVGDPAALSWVGRTALALVLLLTVLGVSGLLGLLVG